MLIRKEYLDGFVGVGEILIEHGLEHYKKFKDVWSKKQKPAHLALEGTTDNPRMVISRPEELSLEEKSNIVISVVHFDNAAELYLKAFLLQNDYIINLPKKTKFKFTDNLDSVFIDKSLNFSDALVLSKKLIVNAKRNRFSEGFKQMHKLRNELYHVGGMGKSFTMDSSLFKSFIESLKILFGSANWYQNTNGKNILNKWEKSLTGEWIS